MGILFEGVENRSGLSTPGAGYGFSTKGVNDLIVESAKIFDNNKDLKEGGIVNKARLAKLLESEDKAVQKRGALTLKLLENLQREIEFGKQAYGESVFFQNFGALAPKVFDIVNIFYPNIIAHDLVDIQPIDSAIGIIYALKPRYSNSAAGVNAGDEVFKTMSPTSSYASEINFDAANGDGSTTTFAFTLATPVRPGTVVIKAGSVVARDNGVNGQTSAQIVGAGITAGTIDYTTGAVSITFATAPITGVSNISVEYFQSHEGQNNIRELEFNIEQIPVQAKPYPVKFKYSITSMLIGKAQVGLDIGETLTQETAFFLKKERDNRLLNKLKANATAIPSLNFDATAPTAYALKDKYASIEIKLEEATNQIQQQAGRGGCNFVVVGQNVAAILKQSSGFRPEAEVPQIGSYRIGTLRDGTIPVIKAAGDQGQVGANDMIFGYKGYTFGDAAIVLAEFIPLYVTAEFQNPNLQNERGLVSMYELKENNTKYLVRGTVSNYGA